MTDSELLEWAAKACGYTIHENGKDINGDTWYWCEHISDCWSPLTDDGDALRLAVKLNMQVTSDAFNGDTEILYNHMPLDNVQILHEDHGDDPYSATRRAIVRAAASIGEQMK